MKLDEFLTNFKIDFSSHRISSDDIPFYEEILGMKVGPQLGKYLLNYGYVGYKHIEMLGINSIQAEKSDLVKVTLNLRCNDEKLNNLIAVENQGDGDYYLVDSDDQIYRYLLDSLLLKKMNIDLESYIVNRLMDV